MNTKLPLHLRLILHLGGSTVADGSPPKGPRGSASGLPGHGGLDDRLVQFPRTGAIWWSTRVAGTAILHRWPFFRGTTHERVVPPWGRHMALSGVS